MSEEYGFRNRYDLILSDKQGSEREAGMKVEIENLRRIRDELFAAAANSNYKVLVMTQEIESLRKDRDMWRRTAFEQELALDDYEKRFDSKENERMRSMINQLEKERNAVMMQRNELLGAFENWRLQLIGTYDLAKVFNEIARREN